MGYQGEPRDLTQVGVHPQPSHKGHPMDGTVLVHSGPASGE
jgi:hypothetical protein